MADKKFACAIWPWGTETKEQFISALKDIKEVGFNYFESVRNSIDVFESPEEYKSIVTEYGVKPVSFYFHMTGERENDIVLAKEHLKFVAKQDVKIISVQTPGAPNGDATPEQLNYTLNAVTELAKMCKEFGIIPCLHPHANTTIMFEDQINFIFENIAPDLLSFCPDTAHLKAGKSDPYKVIEKYIDRVKFMHLKDMADANVDASGYYAGVEVYTNFVELGTGSINLKAISELLYKNNYDGYLTAELDMSKIGNRQSAIINMNYLKENYFHFARSRNGA